MIKILQGDALTVLRHAPDSKFHCCITSPPYFRLRDYDRPGQIGLEPTPDAYVQRLVEVFREVRRTLRDDGTLWLNLGDSYAAGGQNSGSTPEKLTEKQRSNGGCRYERTIAPEGMKAKDLIGIPWLVAFALRADGWYLRQDIIWAKPNPMPESVRDRCTKSHEYLFMLSKSPKYYYDADAVAEPVADATRARTAKNGSWKGSTFTKGKTAEHQLGRAQSEHSRKQNGHGRRHFNFNERFFGKEEPYPETRNRRSVWAITTKPFKEAHFATFPPDLVEPCILAGCPPGGFVLDPFAGSGTVGMVAQKLDRHALLIDLNPDYVAMAERRCGLGVTPSSHGAPNEHRSDQIRAEQDTHRDPERPDSQRGS